MSGIDILKAAGVAIAILAVNVAISFGAVAYYSVFADPGHDAAYYQAAAQWIAPLSSIVFGWLLFFGALRIMSAKPDRNALLFALAVFGVYAAIDVGIIWAVGQLQAIAPVVAVSLASKLVGAIAAVWAAGR